LPFCSGDMVGNLGECVVGYGCGGGRSLSSCILGSMIDCMVTLLDYSVFMNIG
jgi:hypothetical protein